MTKSTRIKYRWSPLKKKKNTDGVIDYGNKVVCMELSFESLVSFWNSLTQCFCYNDKKLQSFKDFVRNIQLDQTPQHKKAGYRFLTKIVVPDFIELTFSLHIYLLCIRITILLLLGS